METYRFAPEIQTTLEQSPIPLAVYQLVDRRVVTLAISVGFRVLLGLEDLQEAYYLMDHDMYRLVHPDDRARVAESAFQFSAEGKPFNQVYRSQTQRDGEYIVVHAQGKHMYTQTGVRLGVIWYTVEGVYSPEDGENDDVMLRSFNQMLREGSMAHQNHFDPLTGLPNMTYFFEVAEVGLEKLRHEGRKPAVLFMDLCGMKAFNNKWGFSEGDRLLREFGQVMVRHFGGECCARFGQDHFAAYADADGVEETLRALFADCRKMNGGRSLPLRVGILPARQNVEIGKLCDRAKMACDLNRSARESAYHYFDESMLAAAERSQYVIENLDRAIAEKWLTVYYQPIVRAANGRVCDEEALSRWNDPVMGFLSPDDFIPTLEKARLIYKLDLYMLDQVLEKLRRQAEAGLYQVPQSINLSRVDFSACDIVEEIRRRVDEAGIPRSLLTIEVTESAVARDFEFMKDQVARFRELGFRVWMDDFGSQYSSLDVLQNIPFDLIKFDMRFLQQSESGDAGRIILTGLIKMAMALGVDTVCEGVETAEQARFLQEVGCTKLQGYYYCKPIPPEEILRRNRLGIQIGFENPAETEYYAAIGRINLYDMSAVTHDDGSLGRYFDTLPAAVLEVRKSQARYIRVNDSYRDFVRTIFHTVLNETQQGYALTDRIRSTAFMGALLRCSQDGNRAVLDERVDEKTTIHLLVRRLAVNPVTGAAAIAIAVLAIVEDQDTAGTTYAHIARALSSTYINLYYVNIESESFIEYTSDAALEDLAVERRGEDFFRASRQDALLLIHKDDREGFVQAFTKENVMRNIDKNGDFILNYRLLIDGVPTYVIMKAVRMRSDRTHIIIGVSNVDDQMRQKETMARIQAERITYSRIAALSGDYICIYTVDPDTDHYIEYSATQDYEGLGLAKEGRDFFSRAVQESRRTVYPEDVERFNALFTRENVMREIERTGLFELRYRLMIDGEPRYVSVKAALAREQDGPQLIIGVNSIDAQVRREMEFERRLSDALRGQE